MAIQKLHTSTINNYQYKKISNPVKSSIPSVCANQLAAKVGGYNISFGNSFESKLSQKSGLDFDESVRKYFRLKPDAYQTEAAKNIYNNADTLVLAPTGTGKTLIAEYAINKNLAEGKTTFYTTPLKALSNEKYNDFCKLYGKENVGLLTGEIKINPQAPILIMTTEIYRNMLVGDDKEYVNDRLSNVATVIYDEFHYMNEPERGEVWETSIMYTPPSIQQLLLSATVENGTVVQKWLNRLLDEKDAARSAEIVDVPSVERHVPLKYYIYQPERGEKLHLLTEEFYNLDRIGKAFVPESKRKLNGKQLEVLSSISLRINALNKTVGNVSAQNGYEYLKRNLEPQGGLDKIEKLLIENLGYSQPEAERAAAILADKDSSKINKSLKQAVEKPKRTKEEKRDFYLQNKPERHISVRKAKEYRLMPKMSRDSLRSLKQFSYLLKGNGSAEDGLDKIIDILKNNDMNVKEFESKLRSLKLNEKYIQPISSLLTVIKYPQKEYNEFSLINVLNKENKLPAIFFRFSKKQCDELRKEYLKTGVSLLSEEEKQEASKIIKKYLDKGVFLGTDEKAVDLLSGVAVHHAGKMPGYKALVEELAQKKLLKVVFATSTLGAGINVPAKTVVFTQLTKYSGAAAEENDKKFVPLTPAEFQQMGGRAGRRGKDFVGNVVVMPDKEHGVQSIYNLVMAKPDALGSSFKPTYSFIAHFIAQEGSAKNLESAVDKSFLQEKLESLGEKPYKIKNKIKKEFNAMASVLTDKDLGCFYDVDGILYPTIKADIVSKARGVDGLSFAEILYNAGLEHLTPAEMAAVACALTPVDERDINSSVKLPEMVEDTLCAIDVLNDSLADIQLTYKVFNEPAVLNRHDAQYVMQWADSADVNAEKIASGETSSRKLWSEIVKYNKSENPVFSEGDFLKSVNSTVDILEQIKEVSRYAAKEHAVDNDLKNVEKMDKINKIATEALKLIKQDPVLYEL